MAAAASGEGGPSDKVCVLQLVLNLTCGSIFLFLCQDVRAEKLTDTHKTIYRLWQTIINTHLRHFLHIVQ